ncbi:unnamed protein product, partial [Ilex paraguariensis]
IADIFTKGHTATCFAQLKSKLLVCPPPIRLRGDVRAFDDHAANPDDNPDPNPAFDHHVANPKDHLNPDLAYPMFQSSVT